jgi:SAM-dependent methyltransferase
MKLLGDIYKGSFFGKRYKLDWRTPIICDAIQNTFNLPKQSSIIDVGCARGEFVAEFEKRGFQAFGVEGSPGALDFICSNKIYFWDLRLPIESTFCLHDLCMCLEVAEHIEEEYCDIFLNNLCLMSNTILISAAPPGCKGHHHVNCQPKQYWEEKFLERNYARSHLKEDSFRRNLDGYKNKKGISGYYQSMIYRRMR